MSTFEDLTKGTSLVASQVEKFFQDIRTTFSPVPLASNVHEIPSDETNQFANISTSPSFTSRQVDKSLSNTENGANLKGPFLVVVVHLLPTLPAYLRSLKLIGTIKIIIFKGPPTSERPEHMREMAEWVRSHEDFKKAVHEEVTKSYLKTPGSAVDLITNAMTSDEANVLIMDIGGYFAPCLVDLVRHHTHGNTWKLLGIVEDTENGHQKYHEALQFFSSISQDLKQPRIYSVARSQMKMTEDYNVGKSLVRAADSILRQALDLRLEDHITVGVIGFGKIGTSIAMHLRQLHIGKVLVYDVNPAVMIRAAAHDFMICSKEQMLQKASFIFCATGNKALTFNDLLRTGSNVDRLVIASCTSADDELDIHDGLKQHGKKYDSCDPKNFSRYKIKRQDGTYLQIILLCDGNATNFACRAILGESIRSVQAAMLVCALNLHQSNMEEKSDTGIRTLTNEEEMTIARLWLEHFVKLDTQLITNVGSADVKLDAESLRLIDAELPIDPTSVTQLKQHLGLQRAADADPIDFMDSERKLIITAPRGSGKTAVISVFIHKVRNYYDFIWWFDCNDSLYGTMIHLARIFHVSSVGLPLDQLQKAVMKAVLSSTRINNFLVLIDNLQEFNRGKVIAESAIDGQACTLKCHDILHVLDEIIHDPSIRHQRRRHILALYTEDSDNQPPSQKPTTPRTSKSTNAWLFLPLKDITTQTATNWVNSKLPSDLDEPEIENRKKLIRKILSCDTRRLTIQLTASLIGLKDLDSEHIFNENEFTGSNPDILSTLVEMLLKKLQETNPYYYDTAQVVSLIKANSISRAVFLRLFAIRSKEKPTPTMTNIFSEWEALFSALKKFNILKKNIVSSTTYAHTIECYIKSEFLEIYSMPSTYARVLRSSILVDKNYKIWKIVFELINQGFNYDYHAVDNNQNMHNIVHFFDHAIVLTKHAAKWNGNEECARLLADLLWRLGSYYRNERRLYTEATEYFRKAYEILEKNNNQGQCSSDEITKWGAKMYWYICEQLSSELDEEGDKSSITKIEECQKNLEQLITQSKQTDEKKCLKKYRIEAIIAISRIHVERIRSQKKISEDDNKVLERIIDNLNKVKEENNIGTRTRSLLLQILGNAY